VTENLIADSSRLLDIGAGDLDPAEAEDFLEGFGSAAWIVDGNGCMAH